MEDKKVENIKRSENKNEIVKENANENKKKNKEYTKQIKINKYLKFIVLILAICIFMYIGINVFQDKIFTWDSTIYNFFMQSRNIRLNEMVIILTELGGFWVITILTIVLLITLKKKQKIMVLSNVIIVTILNQLLKVVFMRPRPEIMRLIEEQGYSFPSGHSMVSTAIYGLLIYLIYKNVKNKYIKYTLCAILSILILIICLSRIYLGVHYASDVIGGICFSIAYLIIFINVFK